MVRRQRCGQRKVTQAARFSHPTKRRTPTAEPQDNPIVSAKLHLYSDGERSKACVGHIDRGVVGPMAQSDGKSLRAALLPPLPHRLRSAADGIDCDLLFASMPTFTLTASPRKLGGRNHASVFHPRTCVTLVAACLTLRFHTETCGRFRT